MRDPSLSVPWGDRSITYTLQLIDTAGESHILAVTDPPYEGKDDIDGDGITMGDCDDGNPNLGSCSSNANCDDTMGVWQCSCNDGYTSDGKTCQSLCDTANGGCDPHASCSNGAGGIVCTCQDGYVGDGAHCFSCQTNNGGCDQNASCAVESGAIVCTCNGGYSGNGVACISNCDTDNGGCDQNATCSNMPGGVMCTCLPGYSGDGTSCTSLCTTNNGGCDPHASCSNGRSGIICQCRSGWIGDGHTCQPYDFCSFGLPQNSEPHSPCAPEATCQDSPPGSYTCTCDPGYSGNGQTCTSLCKSANGGCDANARCSNGPQGVLCTCNPGYTGNGTTCTSLCTMSNGGCPSNAACSNSSQGVVCTCDAGLSYCGGSCVDTASDPANCNGCGKACPAGDVCTMGNCGVLTLDVSLYPATSSQESTGEYVNVNVPASATTTVPVFQTGPSTYSLNVNVELPGASFQGALDAVDYDVSIPIAPPWPPGTLTSTFSFSVGGYEYQCTSANDGQCTPVAGSASPVWSASIVANSSGLMVLYGCQLTQTANPGSCVVGPGELEPLPGATLNITGTISQ